MTTRSSASSLILACLLPALAPAADPPGAPAGTSGSSGGWVKCPGNPVLGGDLGTCFDISVLGENGVYRMWFSWRPRKSIALVESRDGIHWGAPAIALSPTQAGWENDVNRPVVVRRPDGYHMWYTGQVWYSLAERRGRSCIGYAKSPDGTTWTRVSTRPVLSPELAWENMVTMNPSVLWDDQAGLFRMWYSGGEQWEPNAIGSATSPDGRTWSRVRNSPVFQSDRNTPWERERVAGCQVVRRGGWYIMFYIGYRDIDHAQIGVARSRDGIAGWERLPANPIVRPSPGQWDHDACYKPYAILDGGRWLLWYNGRHDSLEQIGLAVHEGSDLGFPE